MTIGRVQPGEIISSTLMNFVLDKLDELESRLDAPSTGDILIERFDPSNGTRVGERMSIIGSNFVFPAEENVVEVHNALVTEFEAPSTSTILTFRVPGSIDIVNENGEDVVIRVSNEVHGSTQARYRLLPPLPGTGSPPAISEVLGVRNDGSLSTILQTGEAALIRGSNFAEEPSANVIRFTLGQNVFSDVVIDEAASTTEEIRITVPIIAQIPVGQQRPVVVEVTTASGTATQQGVFVRRLN